MHDTGSFDSGGSFDSSSSHSAATTSHDCSPSTSHASDTSAATHHTHADACGPTSSHARTETGSDTGYDLAQVAALQASSTAPDTSATAFTSGLSRRGSFHGQSFPPPQEVRPGSSYRVVRTTTESARRDLFVVLAITAIGVVALAVLMLA